MDRKSNNRPPLENSELDKLPQNTMSKNMRNTEDIMADYIADPEKVSLEEERLVDRIVFTKTGKHIGKFNKKKPDPKFDGLVISKDGGSHGQIDPRPADIKRPKEPETSSKVVIKGSKA